MHLLRIVATMGAALRDMQPRRDYTSWWHHFPKRPNLCYHQLQIDRIAQGQFHLTGTSGTQPGSLT